MKRPASPTARKPSRAFRRYKKGRGDARSAVLDELGRAGCDTGRRVLPGERLEWSEVLATKRDATILERYPRAAAMRARRRPGTRGVRFGYLAVLGRTCFAFRPIVIMQG